MEAGNALGLTGVHEKAVVDFLKFARSKRDQRLRAIDCAFEDLQESRLEEDDVTFSCHDVVQMLDGLKSAVRGDIESELIDGDHTQVMLLCQVFHKAQEWKLVLEPNISDLENRQQLEKIAQFENGALSEESAKMVKPKLEPMAGDGPASVMRQEIRELEDENRRLKSQLKEFQGKASSASQEKDALATALTTTKKALDKQASQSQTTGAEVESLQAEIATVREEISKLQSTAASEGDRAAHQATQERLKTALHELLAVRQELEGAKQDLDKKFSESGAYGNMKAMMISKNTTIKELRTRLKKHEGDGQEGEMEQ